MGWMSLSASSSMAQTHTVMRSSKIRKKKLTNFHGVAQFAASSTAPLEQLAYLATVSVSPKARDCASQWLKLCRAYIVVEFFKLHAGRCTLSMSGQSDRCSIDPCML